MKPFNYIKFVVPLIIFTFLLQRCSTKSSTKKVAVLADTTNHIAIDTIITGKWLPFIPDKTDSLVVDSEYKEDFLTNSTNSADSLIADTLTTAKPSPEIDTITKLKPILINEKPEIVVATIPKSKPVKDFRNVSNTNFDIQYLDAEQGLPGSTISGITQDKDGIIWMTTPYGLLNYNGHSIRHFGIENGLPNLSLGKIFIDKKQNIWIIAANRLIKFDGIRFHIYGKEFNKAGENFADVYEDSKGNIWATVMPGDLYCITKKGIYQYPEKDWLGSHFPTTIVEDDAGRIWVGGYGGNPSIIHGDTAFKHLSKWPYRCSDIVMSSMKDSKNNLWFTSYNGGITKRFSKTQHFKTYKVYTGQSPLYYTNVTEDLDGNYWSGSDKSGLLCIKNNGEFELFTTRQGLTDNSVTDTYCDKFGIIWVATQSGGICKINPKSFRQNNNLEGGTSTQTISVMQDHLGNIFVGTWASGLFIKAKDKWISGYKAFGHAIVLDLAEDKNNNIWGAIHGFGVRRLVRTHPDSLSFSVVQIMSGPKSIEAAYVYNMICDSKGDMWFCDMIEGLFHLKGDTIYRYSPKYGKGNILVNAVVESPDGSHWFANTHQGISWMRNDSIKHLTTKEGLLHNETRQVFVSKNKHVWISYANGGFSIYNGKHFSHFSKSGNNELGMVMGFSQGKDGKVWISSTTGLHSFEEMNNHKIKTYSYSIADGLKTNNLGRNSPFLDKDGLLWLTNGKGITTINQNLLAASNPKPNLKLVAITVNGKHISFNMNPDSIETIPQGIHFKKSDKYFNIPNELELAYNKNQVSIEYAGIQWKKSARVLFRHRLAGYNDWSEPSPKPLAEFSNLPPGSYSFEFTAKISDEDWAPVKTYSFLINPPWWQTWWFRTTGICCLLFVIYLVFKWRTKHLLRRQAELELTVKERTSEIEFQKHVIEEKQKETVDSINYARRIQYALLAHDELLNKELPEHFVFFQPKDIVSGDFYWATKTNDNFYLAVCDSTGHGVPGAFMSLLNISFLNEAINEKHMREPGIIFDHTRTRLIENISKEGQQDGMDGVLVSFKINSTKITYAASHNAPVLVSNGKVIVQPADKMPVGKGDNMKPFTTNEFTFASGDMLYLITDGFADQFGGESKAGGKKFKRSNLYTLLEKNSHLPMAEQRSKLEEVFNDWKGSMEQMDDICIIGIRL